MSEKSTQFINELELKMSAFDQVNAELIGLKSQNNELTLLLTQKDDSTNENDQLINELVKEIDDCISLLKN